MPHQQNRFSRFWKELKRRKVIHVITTDTSGNNRESGIEGSLPRLIALLRQMNLII